MIQKLKISGYRSCLDTTIELQPDLSVLIGPNGSGKTNILNAIVLLRSLATEREATHGQVEETPNECELKATFLIEGKKATLTTLIQLNNSENNADVILGSKQSWYAKEFTNSAKRILVPLWLARELLPNLGDGRDQAAA